MWACMPSSRSSYVASVHQVHSALLKALVETSAIPVGQCCVSCSDSATCTYILLCSGAPLAYYCHPCFLRCIPVTISFILGRYRRIIHFHGTIWLYLFLCYTRMDTQACNEFWLFQLLGWEWYIHVHSQYGIALLMQNPSVDSYIQTVRVLLAWAIGSAIVRAQQLPATAQLLPAAAQHNLLQKPSVTTFSSKMKKRWQCFTLCTNNPLVAVCHCMTPLIGSVIIHLKSYGLESEIKGTHHGSCMQMSTSAWDVIHPLTPKWSASQQEHEEEYLCNFSAFPVSPYTFCPHYFPFCFYMPD